MSWGGITNPVKQDARKDHFTIRLWGQGDVVDTILENYEGLDDDIKGELPLRRIWVLADDDPNNLRLASRSGFSFNDAFYVLCVFS